MTLTKQRVSARANNLDVSRGVISVIESLFVGAGLLLVAVIPIEDIAQFGPISLARVVAFSAFALLAARLLVGASLRLTIAATAGILLLLAWTAASYFWSYDQASTLLYFSRCAQLALLVIIVWQVCVTPARLRWAFAALAVGGTSGAFASLLDRVSAHGGAPRYAVGDPNDFGVSLSVSLIVTIHLATSEPRRWVRFLWCVAAAFQVVAVVRTASRTAVAAAILGVLVLACDHRFLRLRTIAAIAGVTVVAYLVGAKVITGLAFGRIIGTFSAVEAGDFNNRGDKWSAALGYWADAPLGGVGGGAFRARSAADGIGTVVHSVWLGLLAELGIVGLMLFVSIIVIAVERAWHARDRAVRRVLLASLVCWLVGSLTLTLEIRKTTWLIVGMTTCAGVAQVARRISAQRTAESILPDGRVG